MKQILTYLQKLNFSETEATIYVLLLNNGPMTIRELSEKAKINRTAVYPHIKSLINKSILIEIFHGSRKKFVACEPDRLASLIDNQLREVTALKTQFPSILTSLNSLTPEKSDENKSEIKYYKGILNARKIYEEALCAREVRAYARVDKKEPLWPSNTSIFNNAFKTNKELVMWEIIYDPDSAVTVAPTPFFVCCIC